MRTRSKPALLCVIGLVLTAWGCGYQEELPTTSEPSPPPAPVTEANLELSVSPSPVNAVVDESDTWSAQWTVNARETAGIGGAIDFVHATLTDSNGDSIAETDLDADQVSEQLGGSNRISGGGMQGIDMTLSFDFPEDVFSGDLNVTLQLSDDRGNTVSAVTKDVIQRCIPTLLAPASGALLDNGCTNQENGILWDFDWSDCEGADFYQIHVQFRSADEPRIDAFPTTSSYTVLQDGVVPDDGRLGWFWRVRANVNGVWGDWSQENSFDVEPVDSDCSAQ